MPWWRILAHSLQAPLSNDQLPLQLVSFCICIRSTQWPSRSASPSPPGLILWTLLINYSSANVHMTHRVQLNGLLALFYLDAGATEISGVGALHPAGPRVRFNHVLWLWEDGHVPTRYWGEYSKRCSAAHWAHLQASIYLSGSLSHFTAACWWIHPQSCPFSPSFLCHFSSSLLPPSVFHLLCPPKCLVLIWSRLPQLLHFFTSVVFQLLHRHIWQSRSGMQPFFKKKVDLSCWCREPIFCRHLIVLLIFVAHSDAKNSTQFERLKSLWHMATTSGSSQTTVLAFLARHQSMLSC